MVIRKSDFTSDAQQLGVWGSLCDMAGVSESSDEVDVYKVYSNKGIPNDQNGLHS